MNPQAPDQDDHNDDDHGYDGPSKSQVKRDMLALQEVGEELVALSKERLAQANLPEALLIAVKDAQRITAHGGRKRQMQYIGRLMRSVEVEPIREYLAGLKGQSAAATAHLHQLERWRERLMADDAAMTELLAKYPQADAQHLRALVRNARKEQAESRPPKAFREIFQALKELMGA